MQRSVSWALVALVVCVPAAFGEDSRTETEPYVGGATLVGGNTVTGCVAMANAADVCFDVHEGEAFADIEIDELSGLPVAAAAKVYGPDFAFLGASGVFCGSGAVHLVPGAAYLVVYPQYSVSTVDACDLPLLLGQANGAKAGFVTVTFS